MFSPIVIVISLLPIIWCRGYDLCFEVYFLASQTVSDIEDTFMLTNSYVDFLLLFVEFNHFLYLGQGKDHLQLIWHARENVLKKHGIYFTCHLERSSSKMFWNVENVEAPRHVRRLDEPSDCYIQSETITFLYY